MVKATLRLAERPAQGLTDVQSLQTELGSLRDYRDVLHDTMKGLVAQASGMFSFGGGVLALLKRFGRGSKHNPERLIMINDINNSRLAMVLWPAISPFVPKHTAAKLRVSGRDYRAMLHGLVAPEELPPEMGGTSGDARWAYVR